MVGELIVLLPEESRLLKYVVHPFQKLSGQHTAIDLVTDYVFRTAIRQYKFGYLPADQYRD